MDLHRLTSFKRSRDTADQSPTRPSKRNSVSPRPSTIFNTPPHTPLKNKSSRSSLHQRTSSSSLGPRASSSSSSLHRRPSSRLLTSFRNVIFPSSPVSDNDEDDDDASISSSSPVTLYSAPQLLPTTTSPTLQDKVCRTLNFDEVNTQLENLHIEPQQQTHAIFQIPEILSKIISYVDEFTSIPCEESPVRRRPLSYQHALLIYKDEKVAEQVWTEALNCTMDSEGNPATSFNMRHNSLYSCLLVNKFWYRVTLEVASTKLFFSDEDRWSSFVKQTKQRPRALHRANSNTRLFIMHKLTRATQDQVNAIAPSVSGNLEWIEMYICPQVLPPQIMLMGAHLKKLVIPGSKVVDDRFLRQCAKASPGLEHLDLRACGLVSDDGVAYLAQRCRKLKSLNLGRHSHTTRITDVTMHALAVYCTQLETLGVAGCAITDRGLWEVALRCSKTLTRLSLNNCVHLTDHSVPQILVQGYFSHLAVLELRHCLQITNFAPMVMYKRSREHWGDAVLIEGCEVLEYRMRNEEWRQDMRNSARMLNDIKQWCLQGDDGDVPFVRRV